MKHKKYLCKILIFAILTCLLLTVIVRILTPKFYYDTTWPTTSGYQGFYQMEKDSVDVLFLGSSTAAAGFDPQAMYDSYGIKSYNLGCEGQSLLTSYYWLKEALRFQSPKVVILETYFVFAYDRFEPLNAPEGSNRKAFDNMRWSGVKWEAVHDICEHDPDQTLSSYYFPNMQYHTRWTQLEENDFMYPVMNRHYELKGFAPLSAKGGSDSYVPFGIWDSSERADMVPLMKEYMDKIVELCNENDIRLILTKLPYTECNVSKYNTISDYALEHDIAYWDFNEESLYNACGFVSTADMNDAWHTNIWGAEKVSVYIASRLQDEYGITGGQDEQWDSTVAYHDSVYQDCMLKNIMDIDEYIDAICQEHYTILVSVKGDGTYFLDESVKQHFAQLAAGFSMDYEENGSYFATIHEGKAEEGASKERLVHHGSTRGGLLDYEITSAGYDSSYEGRASIKINDQEYAKNKPGLNIVVYNNERKQVVDSICYNGVLDR
ncbi:MAG: hypothetical protein NC314_11425 [Roseburia sp.]|nr:hypothetical protein [Roseburia sp.]